MGSFGERLRREREMRRVSLEEIAAATKIGTRSLKALEDEDFSKLPGGIFNKGFVRAYAKFLGMNEDQAVADYVAAAGEAEQHPEMVIEKLAAESERRAEERRIREQNLVSAESLFSWNTIAIVVVIAVAAVLGWQYYGRHRAQKPASANPGATAAAPLNAGTSTGTGDAAPSVANPAATPTTTQPSAAATQSSGSQPTSAPTGDAATAATAAAADAIVVTLKVNDNSWISAEPDGTGRSQRLMPAGSEATFHARKRLKLILGNAGGVEVSFNGKPQPLTAEKGQPRTLIFTPEGLQP